MKGLGFIICLVAVATTAGIARAPQVVVADGDFDFGRVLTGTLVEHEFVVKNERAVPLVIDEVRLTPPLTLAIAPASVAAGAWVSWESGWIHPESQGWSKVASCSRSPMPMSPTSI